jgi:hypothetical protein
MLEAGMSLVGALFGNRRLSTAASGATRVFKQRGDVGRATENVDALRQQLADLDAQLEAALSDVDSAADAAQKPLAAVSIAPKKTNVAVQRVALAWVPSEG